MLWFCDHNNLLWLKLTRHVSTFVAYDLFSCNYPDVGIWGIVEYCLTTIDVIHFVSYRLPSLLGRYVKPNSMYKLNFNALYCCTFILCWWVLSLLYFYLFPWPFLASNFACARAIAIASSPFFFSSLAAAAANSVFSSLFLFTRHRIGHQYKSYISSKAIKKSWFTLQKSIKSVSSNLY